MKEGWGVAFFIVLILSVRCPVLQRMRSLALVLALACASCLAAPGRLSGDQQTRDAVDEFSRWRDSRKPPVQQDVGQETEDLRQQFEDIEQHFAEMGQQLQTMDEETGQRTLDLGQQLEDVRQLVLQATPPSVQAGRVSLSEEDVGQVPDTPSSTPRPRPSNRLNPVQMQRASSSPRTPTVHQIVQEASLDTDLLIGQVVVPAVTQKPTVRGDQISMSGEDLTAGQLSVPVGQVSEPTCIGGIVIGSVCYQSWDSDEDHGVRATTGRPQPSTPRPVQTTTTQKTTPSATSPPRLTAPVARAMSSGVRTTTSTTVRPEITTTERAPARVSVSEEQTDDQTVSQVVQQRPQQIRQKPKVVGQVNDSSEEGGQVYERPEDLGQRPVAVQQRPQQLRKPKVVGQVDSSSEEGGQVDVQPDQDTEDLGQRPVAVQQPPQQIRQKPKVVGQVNDSSEEDGQVYVLPDDFGQRPVAAQQFPTNVPHRPQQIRQTPKIVGQVETSSEDVGQVPENLQQRPVAVQQLPTAIQQQPQQIRQTPKVVGQVENSSEDIGQVPENLGWRPQAVQQQAGPYSQSSEETGQIIYKPDEYEQRPTRVTQRPEQRVSPGRPLPSTTVRPAVPRRVGQLQDPEVEGSEELGRIASYIRDKVNEEQDEDYDAGQQTVQTDWQSLRQVAQQVDVRAGQQLRVQG
jgi:hypothetical protein